MQVSIVIGNPKAGGRTTRVAQTVCECLIQFLELEIDVQADTIELAEVAGRLFEWEDEELSKLSEKVASSDLVVIACPVYKASYTGLLKAFLDRYNTGGMSGTVSLPVMLGASPAHALAVENHLRPLLVELGSSVPSRGFYLVESQLEELDQVVSKFVNIQGPALRKALSP